MDTVLLVARLLLAAVFLVAGSAKLADLAGSRRAMGDFGVPERLAEPVGILLPIVELIVAIALLPTPTAWWGALGALALLLAFVVGIAASLARGKRPDCHCFGQLYSSSAGPWTLFRNAALAAVAVLILWQGRNTPGPSVVAWIGNLSPAERVATGTALLALMLAAVEGWALIQLMGQNGRLLLRLDAMKAGGETAVPTSTSGAATVSEPSLPVGTPAPGFSLSGLHGETLTLEALRAAGQPVVLIFVDPNCGPCNALLPEIGRWQRTYHGALTMALVTRGAPEVNRSKSTEHGLTYVLLQLDREVAQAYQAHGTPSGVLVRPDGTIGSPLAHGATAIRSLVERGARESASIPTIGVQSVLSPDSAVSGTNGSEDGAAAPTQPAARIGTPAPTLRLPDLEGHAVDLQSFHGERVLVLFWNPACGFCARMLNALKAWDDAALPGAPRLLVVSTGSTEANRNMGLRSTVVLDQGFVIGQSFGTSGTPSAVLVDADGLVASEVAVGAKAILKLAGVLPAEPVATR